MSTTSTREPGQCLDGRALVRAEAKTLAAIVALTAIGTLSEAGFLVLVARAGVALANSSDELLLVGDRSTTVSAGLIIAAILTVSRFVASIASAALSSRAIARSTIRIRDGFTDAFLATSWEIKHALAPGRVQQLLSDYTRRAVNVVSAVSRGLAATVSLIALVGTALAIQPFITLLSTVLVAVLGTAMVPLRRLVKRSAASASDTQIAFGTRINELESLALEIETHGVRTPAAVRVSDDAHTAADALRRAQFAQLAIAPSYQLVAFCAVVGLLIVGVSTGIDDIGTVGAVMVLLLRCLAYGQALQVAKAHYANADVYAVALADEMALYHEATPVTGRLIPTVTDGVRAQNLNFSYGDVPTLRDLSFDVPSGATVGIIGPSGSGKSTLAQLLVGLRPSGRGLTVDGVPVDEADPGWWSSEVSLVPQHSNLLTGTVLDNVRFLRSDITPADVESACKRAAIHDEILAMGGYTAQVGERGGALSGGQQQRLCIARALAGEPSLLVLDEATSALDADAEQRVLAALAERSPDVTVMAVTHRPAVLDICDHILHLEDGSVSFFGPKEHYDHDLRERR